MEVDGPVVEEGEGGDSVNESGEESDRARSVSEEDLERHSRILDVVSLQEHPRNETNNTDDERSENLSILRQFGETSIGR